MLPSWGCCDVAAPIAKVVGIIAGLGAAETWNGMVQYPAPQWDIPLGSNPIHGLAENIDDGGIRRFLGPTHPVPPCLLSLIEGFIGQGN